VKRYPHRSGMVPRATAAEECQRVMLSVPSTVRLRLEALEQRRLEAGGAEKAAMPHPTLLDKDERQYLSCIRRLCYQGDSPQPGSIGPAPWYLTLQDATDYTGQRLAMHRHERTRLERVEATGDHVHSPTLVVADCIQAGLALPTRPVVANDHIQASVPLSLLRAAGHREDGRDLPKLLRDLPGLLDGYGLVGEEVESLVAAVAAMGALPAPESATTAKLSAAVVAGLPIVERADAARAGRGGLASQLPPTDVWRCATWERLRAMGREVPPLSWR